MNATLEKELTGAEPVTVELGGKSYPLSYSMWAVLQYKQLTGDNLFQGDCWEKIAPLNDPHRFIDCLFVGLHVYDPKEDDFITPFTRLQLESLVDFGNVNDTVLAITKALTRFFPKVKPKTEGETQLPAGAKAGSEASPSPCLSPNSGPAPATTSS